MPYGTGKPHSSQDNRNAFRKDYADETEESDEYCPHCDNHFVIEAKTPQPVLKFEVDDPRKVSTMMEAQDQRLKKDELRTIFDVEEAPNKLG
ncbi:zinc finger protein [Rutstroemia sp. NJR-2017a WRK4]|nr:zinc finger protein [Rutstroemia sp. NJR-2017a WRK4]